MSDLGTPPTTGLSAAGPSKDAEAEFSTTPSKEQIRTVVDQRNRHGALAYGSGAALNRPDNRAMVPPDESISARR